MKNTFLNFLENINLRIEELISDIKEYSKDYYYSNEFENDLDSFSTSIKSKFYVDKCYDDIADREERIKKKLSQIVLKLKASNVEAASVGLVSTFKATFTPPIALKGAATFVGANVSYLSIILIKILYKRYVNDFKRKHLLPS